MKEEIVQKVVSIIYLVYGLINLVIFSLSGFSVIYLSFIGVLCLIAGGGLWLRLGWSVQLAIPLGLILLVIGIVTLYASVSLAGFSPSQSVLLLNLALIAYIAASSILVVYLAVKGRATPLKTRDNEEKT